MIIKQKHRNRYGQKLWINFRNTTFFLLTILCHLLRQSTGFKVAVFGGSGFIGRRICEVLVKSGDCEVCSISKSGKPPTFYCDNSWADKVEWISYDFGMESSIEEENIDLGTIDAAISCVGNMDPCLEWKQLFGLGFDNDKLMVQNGAWNERICELSKNSGAQNFVFLSVNYETSKAFEGPIPGYIYGKRRAESKAYNLFGPEKTFVLGLPPLVYGGNRFQKLGDIFRKLVESPIAKSYVGSNDFLRSLSSAPMEDWFEKMLFSSPVLVENVARVACLCAFGNISKDIVGPRKQGFFDTDGKPVFYDDVVFIDGTNAIEDLSSNDKNLPYPLKAEKKNGAPDFEGALVGQHPWLWPIPVAGLFGTIFWAVATQQFVQVDSNLII